jgi:hypothetical protein
MTMPGQPDPNINDPRRPTRPTTSGGPGLRTAFTFMIVWFTCALIGTYATRLMGFQRGEYSVGMVVGILGLSCLAAAVITWAVRRRR